VKWDLGGLDVTGGAVRQMDFDQYRFACLLCVLCMPGAGLKDAFDHLKDTFEWYGRRELAGTLIDSSIEIRGKALDVVEAQTFSIDEE
jgi:hypothetical protein